MIRGLDAKQEQSTRQLARDTRPLGVRISESFAKPEVMLLIFGTSIATTFAYPMITDILFIVCTCLFFFSVTRKTTLPFRIPRSINLKDYNDPLPGSNKPRIGEGIFFLGNDRITKEELWFSNDDLRTHVLIFGSTGSGKTEALVSMAFNSLLFASGFIYIDGKGDNSLFAKVFSMVRSMGRDDDMLLINFMTGARDVLGPQKTRLSNTMNPFSRGSSSMLSQLVVSLMSSGKGGGGDDMWTNRAINFVESLMKVLAAMRDAGHILLDANSIRGYFLLEKLEQIVVDRRFPISDTYSVSLDLFPKQILEPLNAYMDNLPGYSRQKKGNQGSEVREQHGFITMQLTRVFGSLADAYGHIIRTNLAEVDFKDVVLNRRIMVVLLPALEKSPQELSNLGKIIVASLKAMMAAGLGDEVEGDYRDVVLRKPTTASSPFLTIMDEYGYYAVEGFAVVPAQARSLGFAAIFAGQDLPAFQKASKEEAASIGANCNIKICMKLEDPQETWEFFNKVAGESYTTSVSGFQMDSGSLTMNYMDTRSASVDKRQRIDLLDLKDQRPGEFHVFFKSKIIRAEAFYAAPKPVKKMRLNQFLKVEAPSEALLIDIDKRFKRFSQVFATPHYEFAEPPESHDIKILVQSFQGAINLKPFERGIAALISLLEEEVQKQRDLSVPFEEPGMEHEMSAFTKVFVTPMALRMIGSDNQEMFSLPLIRRGSTTEELIHIERLSGKSEQEAKQLSDSMIQDIESATKFPPVIQFKTEPDQILQDISDIIVMFGGAPLDIAGLKASTVPIAEQDEIDDEISEKTEASADTNFVAGGGELSEIPEFPELPNLEELFEEEDSSLEDESEKMDEGQEEQAAHEENIEAEAEAEEDDDEDEAGQEKENEETEDEAQDEDEIEDEAPAEDKAEDEGEAEDQERAGDKIANESKKKDEDTR
ncbi:MAG TPA: TraM recognition domain-containing protein, partial [Gammaproteobacteria bacterium]|nr:TraM recognition domain-containing protein [Gammaproteobacteria bacterium]